MSVAVPWLFLTVSIVGLLFTANALRSVRGIMPLMTQSFFAGWLTTELALHHVVWQIAACTLFVAAGALSATPGWVGLVLSMLSWTGLLFLHLEGHRTKLRIEHALALALGANYRSELSGPLDVAFPRGRLIVPFWLTFPGVRVIKNLRYAPGAGRRRLLDLVLPSGHPVNAPVLLQIHGGAWIVGHKAQQARPLMHYMASRGFICVSMNYRLSPRARWPDHLIDAKHALAWIREHIAEYGGDPNFVIVTGGSAGGHLASMLALTANQPRYQPGFEHVDTRVNAAIPFYAPYDFLDREQKQPTRGLGLLLRFLVIGKARGAATDLYYDASPLSHVHQDAPPFFVIHGTHDSLTPIEEARLFVEHLRAVSKQPVAFAELPFAQHAFEIFHSPRALHAVQGAHRFASAVHAAYLADLARQQAAVPKG